MITGQPQGASQIAQGATLYVFNRKDFSVAMANVQNVSQPHVSKAAQMNPALGMQGFVVDLSLAIGNDTVSIEYPVNSAGANYPDKGWYISPDPMVTAREIEVATNNSKQFLTQVPYHEMVVQKSPSLIMQVLPEKRIEAQQAEKISSMEKQIAEMTGKFGQLVEMFSAAFQNQKTKEK